MYKVKSFIFEENGLVRWELERWLLTNLDIVITSFVVTGKQVLFFYQKEEGATGYSYALISSSGYIPVLEIEDFLAPRPSLKVTHTIGMPFEVLILFERGTDTLALGDA